MTTEVVDRRPQPGGATGHKGFRGDLEGLRAVAVVLVLLDHLFQWPRGGFVGVDVFFVLSGFLITSLLLKEYDRTGTISFRGFYLRRIKRILPASTLVIVVTAIGAYTVFLGARAHQALTDGLWSLLFAANWRFVLVGQDYFAQDRSASPFQHYWSLAVEEQFYFVWPLLIFVALAASARLLGGSKGRWVLGGLLGAVTITSLIWSLLETTAAPLVAYFSTFSRAWELSVGGLLALIVASRPTVCRFPRLLSWLGLLTIAVAAVLIDPSSNFPGPWALLPVAGALLVIGAGAGVAPGRLNPALTHSASRYIGKISFSLYLWHWPVIVIASALLDEGALYFGVAVGATAILSVVSFHLVEDPIRRSSWLTRPPGSRSPLVSEYRARRVQAAGLALLGMVTAVIVGYALLEPRTVPALAEPASAAQTQPFDAEAADRPGEGGLSREIQIAIEARDWPSFRIDLDGLEEAKVDEWTADGCIDIGESDLARCTYDSPAEGLAVVVGDSVAVSWLPAIRGALEPKGYATLSLTMGQCPAVHVAVGSHDNKEGFDERCADHREWATSVIDRLEPDLVLVSSAENSLRRLTSAANGSVAQSEWTNGTELMLEALTSEGRTLVVLSPPPEGRNLQSCVTRFSSPTDCISQVGELWMDQNQVEEETVDRWSAEPVVYVDTRPWFCNPMGECPAFVQDIPMRADGNHLTGAYSEYLAGEVADALHHVAPRMP